MKLIIGLGNPGEEYKNTRHNVGFMVIDEIAKRIVGNEEVILAKPQTFMNNSGSAVKKLADSLRLTANSLIIVHDDITLDPGQVKISKGAGAGKHNGVQSIIDHLKTKDFIRVRCGIGRGDGVLSDVVLSKFKPDEKKVVDEMIQKAADICVIIVEKSIEKAINTFNQ